ncbi:M23 family peptidase [Plantactinospora mayteni]|uniref:M23 family peptidase n=1 Tax=Plantactinospora mayteni TaxID=566021 RepID=UPI0031EAB846
MRAAHRPFFRFTPPEGGAAMRKLISLIIALLAAIIAIPLLGGAAIFGGGGTTCIPTTAAPATTAPAAPGPVAPSGPIPPVEGWDAEQLGNVATILTVGNSKAVPPSGWVVATATAMQESTLRNLPGGADDSIGLFQQRPSQGRGTPEQLRDPAYQAGKFFDKLVTIEGWQQMPLTEAAQAVQRSAHPDAYAKHTAETIRLVSHVGAALGLSTVWINPCGEVSAQGWTQPVRALVVSGFRTSARPGHDGVDLGAARHTTIVAAASGTVQRVRCNAIDSRTGGDWGCHRDGNPNLTKGCGMLTAPTSRELHVYPSWTLARSLINVRGSSDGSGRCDGCARGVVGGLWWAAAAGRGGGDRSRFAAVRVGRLRRC